MLCTVCDNITLKSLNRPYGYKHMPSFHALQASAEGGLCTLCDMLWKAVDGDRTEEAEDGAEDGAEEEKDEDDDEDDILFMDFPVRLTVNGMFSKNKDRAFEKIRKAINTEERDAARKLYDLRTAKAPTVLSVCSLQPEVIQLGLKLTGRGNLLLYQEPGESK